MSICITQGPGNLVTEKLVLWAKNNGYRLSDIIVKSESERAELNNIDVHPLRSAWALIQQIAGQSDDPLKSGYVYGKQMHPSDLGLFGLALQHCKHGAQAAAIIARMQVMGQASPRLYLRQDVFFSSIYMDIDTNTQNTIKAFLLGRELGFGWVLLQHFGGPSTVTVDSISLSLPYARQMQLIANDFRCEVSAEHTFNKIKISNRLMTATPTLRNPVLASSLIASCIEKSHFGTEKISESVKALMYQREQWTLSKKSVALLLNMSERTFSRVLIKEGLTWRQLITNIKHQLAMSWLKNSELSILDIAKKVGFSDASAFNKSFKKIEGMSPSEYRRTSKFH